MTNLNILSEGENILSFSLSGEDADKFEIIDGNTLKLKTGTLADYENQSTYNISISLTFQAGSETKTVGLAKEFVITVTDSEENQISGTGSINQDSFEVITGSEVVITSIMLVDTITLMEKVVLIPSIHMAMQKVMNTS